MERPRLILHAGLHKTGTSAIQTFAHAHAHALWERGLWYPTYAPIRDLDLVSHNRLAHSIARTRKRSLLDEEELGALTEHWRTHAEGRDILVSAEALCRHTVPMEAEDWAQGRDRYVERVARVLADFDVQPLLVLRRQNDLAHSSYIENIEKAKRRGKMSFADFRADLARHHLRYEENLGRFERCFGDTRVLIYEDLRRDGSLCRAFFGALGIDPSGLAEPGRINSSLSVREARIKKRFLPFVFSRRHNATANRLARSGLLARLTRDHTEHGFWASAEERARFQSGYAAENERIRARFLPERATLFA